MKNLKLAARETPDRTTFSVEGVEVGRGFVVIAGPCSVENEKQIMDTARAVKAIYQELKDSKRPVAALILKTLWPVPAAVIRRAASRFKRVGVVEMNLGQYVLEIQRILADRRVDFYGQMDGRLISPYKIKESLLNG